MYLREVTRPQTAILKATSKTSSSENRNDSVSPRNDEAIKYTDGLVLIQEFSRYTSNVYV